MEHEGTSPYSLVPVLSQIGSVTTVTMDFMNMHFNILTFMFKSSKWSLSVRLSYQNLAGIFPSPMCNVFLAYLIFLWFGCSKNIWVRSTDHQSPQFAVPSSPMWHPSKAQISFSAPCSQTPSACVPPSVYQVSHPYKITGKIIVLNIWIPIFLDSKMGERMFCIRC
jgi:hypothetical protein